MHTFISREQDYALRLTARLAELKKGEQKSIRELSKEMHVSKIFAARIVHRLKHAGIVGTTQGKQGGVFLVKSPKNLSAYQVLSIIGFKVKFNQCLDDKNCALLKLCRFHEFFVEQDNKLMESLKKMRISDFTFTKNK